MNTHAAVRDILSLSSPLGQFSGSSRNHNAPGCQFILMLPTKQLLTIPAAFKDFKAHDFCLVVQKTAWPAFGSRTYTARKQHLFQGPYFFLTLRFTPDTTTYELVEAEEDPRRSWPASPQIEYEVVVEAVTLPIHIGSTAR
ncbi:hypothetical protein NDU88_006136 [Pleurodeles waltl]|uniref:Uncharacterized protein n=1 Tax=Pleurodeles waltl TaxID=8319 RepID=A0AAV7NR30_PLEWA|nr:hypothetical protein NDU88_006136 [Pleurodeles waltl]